MLLGVVEGAQMVAPTSALAKDPARGYEATETAITDMHAPQEAWAQGQYPNRHCEW
jgi:hypothetical protein